MSEAPVLLVEDDPADVRLIQRAFGKLDKNVPMIRLTNGDDAVAYLSGLAPILHTRPTHNEDPVMAENAEKVKDIIEKELGVEREKLSDDASFIEDLGADSLDIVELVMEFEKEFNIDIPDEDAEKLRTVGDAVGYLNQKMASNA